MTQIATSPGAGNVPAPIVEALRKLIRRARAVIAVRGVCATLAVLIASLLAVMALDAVLTLVAQVPLVSAWPRWAMSASAWAATVLAGLWWLVRPLARSFTLTGIARAIETRHPELHERISSAVELLTSRDAPELRGSGALIAALASEATVEARSLRPRREVSLRSIRPFVITACVTAGLLAALLLTPPGRLSFYRAVAPHVRLANLAAGDIRIIEPLGGSVVIPKGDDLRLVVELSGGRTGKVELRRSAADEPVLALQVLPAGEGAPRFAITLSEVRRSFRYRIRAGAALTAEHSVTVASRPAVDRFDVSYEYPSYTRLLPRSVRASGGDISAISGTKVTVTAYANKPVAEARVFLNHAPAEQIPVSVSPGADGVSVCTLGFELSPKVQGQWELRLRDEHGFASLPRAGAVEAVPDAAPAARITSPTERRLRLRRDSKLPVAYEVADDFGISRAELTLEADGTKVRSMPLAADRAPGGGSVLVDLSGPAMAGARRVTVRVRALDNLPEALGGPQEGASDVLTIELDPEAKGYGEQVVLADELRIRQVLEEVYEKLKAARNDTRPLAASLEKAARSKAAPSKTDAERIDRVRPPLAEAEVMLHDLVRAIAGGSFAALGEKLQSVADDHVAPARELTGRIRLTDDGRQRAGLAADADFHVSRAMTIVSDILKELHVLTEAARSALEFSELAERQEDLAAAKAAMEAVRAGDEEMLEALKTLGLGEMTEADWQQSQQRLADQLGQIVRETPAALRALAEQDTARSKDLASQARELEKRQTETAEQTRRVGELDQVDKQLGQLAKEQQDLAKEAQSQEPTRGEAKRMAAAAEDIRKAALGKAVERQGQAAEALKGKADELKAKLLPGDLAKLAREIAGEQKALAESAKRAKDEAAAAQEKARQAAGRSDEALRRAKEARGKQDERLAALGGQQAGLASEARELEEQASTQPAGKEATKVKPSAPMMEAAEKLEEGKAAEAKAKADEATRRAKQLAERLEAGKSQASTQPTTGPTTGPATRAAPPEGAELAERARTIADKQERLAEAIAQAAEEAKKVALSRQGAQQAEQERGKRAAEAESVKRNVAAGAEKQRQLAQKAQELNRQAESAPEEIRQAVREQDPSREMTEAARAMQAAEPDKASVSAERAAHKAKALADKLGELAGQRPVTDETRRQAKQTDGLADKQAQLRRRTEELAQARKRLAAAGEQTERARLQREQSRVAREAAELAEQVRKHQPQADRLDTRTARAAEESAQQMRQSRTAQAAEKATEAAKGLRQLADRFGAGDDPDEGRQDPDDVVVEGSDRQEPGQVSQADQAARKKAELADRADDLAHRQGTLAEQMKVLAEGDRRALAESRQREISADTAKLAELVAVIDEHARDLIPDESARDEARQAAGQLAGATRAQQQAQAQMRRGAPARAVPSQQHAAESLASAAAALERLGQKLAAVAGRTQDEGEDAGELLEAFEQADEAARTQQADPAAQAARQLAQLARQAMARARALGLQPAAVFVAGRPALASDPRVGTGAVPVHLTDAQLEALGISRADWMHLPGSLRDQVLQAAGEDSPPEYRELIRQYFREIARRGGAPPTEEKP